MLKTIAALGDLLRRSKRAYNYFYDESRISVMIEFVLYCCSKSWQYDKDLISLAALLRTRHGKCFQVKILSNWFILFIKFSLNNHRFLIKGIRQRSTLINTFWKALFDFWPELVLCKRLSVKNEIVHSRNELTLSICSVSVKSISMNILNRFRGNILTLYVIIQY